jgi:hypothetical protein
MDSWPAAWLFPPENFIWLGLVILLVFSGVLSIIGATSNRDVLRLLQAIVVVAAVGLLAYEWSYFHNRQAYGIQTSGMTIDKISVDDCFAGPAQSLDPALKDWNQARLTACRPWLTEHYLKWAALGLVTLGFLAESERRKRRARRATG